MNKKNPLLTFGSLIIIFFDLDSNPLCVHEPVKPEDMIINPIDTIENPIDTTQNPIDTTQIDTVIKACDPDTIYFSQDILPVLISNCAKKWLS